MRIATCDRVTKPVASIVSRKSRDLAVSLSGDRLSVSVLADAHADVLLLSSSKA